MHERQPSTELLVYNEPDACAYLPNRTSRLLMHLPLARLTGDDLDARLAAGYRRTGRLMYQTACPACHACEALRVPVGEFTPSRTQRRVFRRGQASFETRLGWPAADSRRVELYNQHKIGRDLLSGEGPIDLAGYHAFLVESCCETFEIRYFVNGELVGVAVTDRGQSSLSAVYCYFDPAYARLSPGTYSILTQIALCRAWGLRYLYLGYYIAERCRMTYKADFRPNERLLNGRWVR